MSHRIRGLAASLATLLGLAGSMSSQAAGAAAANGPLVHTIYGDVRGVNQGGVDVFRGIPFAGDVSGAGRWRPPQAPAHWRGVRDATTAGPICPQPESNNGKVLPWLAPFHMSEDCLNLSVYTPSLKPGAKAPVMVWIHGGYARIGTGSRHDGTKLTKDGVVVVTINYRLGRLGLFAEPALTASQPHEMLGNYGLMDMVASLRWVKANIKAFGGDPDNVTIFGQSSGAVAVTTLMISPEARGLYQKAIAQSGSIAVPGAVGNLSTAEHDGEKMAKALHVDPSKDVPSQLRALPWQALVAYTAQQPANAMAPIIDGKLIPRDPVKIFAEGQENPAPFMGGSVGWEQSLVAAFDIPLAAVLQGVPPDEARAVYGNVDDKTLVGEWFADTDFHAPARYVADEMHRHGQPAYVYQFAHLGSSTRGGQPGAAHSDDVPYLFTQLGITQSPAPDQDDLALGETMRAYWTNFARSGNPNGPGLPTWPQYATQDQAVMVLDTLSRVSRSLLAERTGYQLQRYKKAVVLPESAPEPGH